MKNSTESITPGKYASENSKYNAFFLGVLVRLTNNAASSKSTFFFKETNKTFAD